MGKQSSRLIVHRIGKVIMGVTVFIALALVILGVTNFRHSRSVWWIWSTLPIVFAILILLMLFTHGMKSKTVRPKLSGKQLRKQEQAEQSRSVVEDYEGPYTGGV